MQNDTSVAESVRRWIPTVAMVVTLIATAAVAWTSVQWRMDTFQGELERQYRAIESLRCRTQEYEQDIQGLGTKLEVLIERMNAIVDRLDRDRKVSIYGRQGVQANPDEAEVYHQPTRPVFVCDG